MADTLDFLTLTLLQDVGPRTIRELAGRGPLRDALSRPDEHADLLPAPARAALKSGAARRQADEQSARARDAGAEIVGLSDRGYPDSLLHTYDPPPVLYVKGKLKADEGQWSVGIVGSRNASPQGVALARHMSRVLAGAGATVVSGLARGIDAAAHNGALDAGGRTVAVLGSALDRLYPREHSRLGLSIVDGGGALVSEFPFGTPPAPGHFPRRNRVLAGWGKGVVVVEAARRSGALITARLALEEGREVLAVPGHPSYPGAEGANQLIVDGATLVRDAADVARALEWQISAPPADAVGADTLLASLKPDAPATLEEIEARCGRPTGEILARLAELELAEQVRRLPGPLFVRA